MNTIYMLNQTYFTLKTHRASAYEINAHSIADLSLEAIDR